MGISQQAEISGRPGFHFRKFPENPDALFGSSRFQVSFSEGVKKGGIIGLGFGDPLTERDQTVVETFFPEEADQFVEGEACKNLSSDFFFEESFKTGDGFRFPAAVPIGPGKSQDERIVGRVFLNQLPVKVDGFLEPFFRHETIRPILKGR